MQTLEALVHCYKDGLGLPKFYKLVMVKESILMDLKMDMKAPRDVHDGAREAILTRLFRERYSKNKV